MLQKFTEHLRDGVERAAQMNDLVESSFHCQSAHGNFRNGPLFQLVTNRDARQNGKSKSRHQRFLDRLGAAEFHGDVEQSVGGLSPFGEQLADRVERP